MEARGITEQEVWDVLANPSRGTYVPKTRRSKEFYGLSKLGLPMTVVTDLESTVVITVYIEEGSP